MQVSIEQTSGLERRLTIGVLAEEVDGKVNEKLLESAKTVRLAGFRPGKVPFKVVRQRFGAGIRQEVVGEVVSRSFYEAVTQEDVRPAGQPSIEETKNEPGQDLEFIAIFEVYPEIELSDFAELSIARPHADITAEDVDKMISDLRQQRANWEKVDRAAINEDRVKIDYSGTRDGQQFEGGSAEGSELVLGSGRMIPGFEDGIIDMCAGEEKTITLTFPEDYASEDLKGAEVEFFIKVNEVNERRLPDLNDDFFEQFGVQEGGEEKFREEVRNNMDRELAQATKVKTKDRLFKALSELHEFELPRALVSSEIASTRQRMVSQFGGQQQFDASVFPDDLFSGEAEKRVKLGLIIAEIIKQIGLEADADKVRAQIEESAATYEQPDQVIQYYYGNEQALKGVESAVLEEQVVDHLLSFAQIKEESISYQDALKTDPQELSEPEDAPA